MCVSAPRVDRRLVAAVVRLDDPTVPIAEVYRHAREHAAKLGIPRPSYECFRMLVHDIRRERARHRANRQTIIRVALYLDPVDELTQLERASYLRM